MKQENAGRLLAAVVAVFGFCCAQSAEAIVILNPGSVWEYTFANPTGSSDWNTTMGHIGNSWSLGQAPYGNDSGSYNGSPNFNFVTYWPADGSDGDDLWVRIAVDLSGFDLASIVYGLGVDNGFRLFANGNMIGSGYAEGYTHRWEYSGGVAQNVLHAGVNVFAVALEDRGGLTAFDMQLTGNRVPDGGASLLMLGVAMAGVAAFRRRIV